MTTPLPDRLRTLADNLEEAIQNKLNPAIGSQNYTARRASIAEGMRKDGYHLQKIQTALYALADAHQDGIIPDSLVGVKSKKEIESLLWKGDPDLLWLIKDRTPDNSAREKTIQLEKEAKRLIGLIPGYFPTPGEIIDRMIELARLQPDDLVLEPSAGAGDICLKVKQCGATVDAIEISPSLIPILKARGIEAECADFLEVTPVPKYDKIIMNPPFERGQDVTHVQHAFQFLKPGGVLVSVTSESPWFRSEEKFESFRNWVDELNGYTIDLPAGAFASSLTGVKTRLLILQAPW